MVLLSWVLLLVPVLAQSLFLTLMSSTENKALSSNVNALTVSVSLCLYRWIAETRAKSSTHWLTPQTTNGESLDIWCLSEKTQSGRDVPPMTLVIDFSDNFWQMCRSMRTFLSTEALLGRHRIVSSHLVLAIDKEVENRRSLWLKIVTHFWLQGLIRDMRFYWHHQWLYSYAIHRRKSLEDSVDIARTQFFPS